MKAWLLMALLAFSGLVAYCLHSSQRVLFADQGRPAVRFRQLQYRLSRVAVLDLDLTCPNVRVEVAAADATPRYSGCSTGAARTVADWCRTTGAIGGVNGGFFGRERGAGRKEIVGLLKLAGALYGRAPRYWDRHRRPIASEGVSTELRQPEASFSHHPIPYVHSALGFDANGRPAIDWVASDPERPAHLLSFSGPEGLRGGSPWRIASGLSGGPRLITHGRIRVSDRSERLASSGLLPRTFVGYADEAGSPRYLVLAVATAMTFQDAADFLESYFHRFHDRPCAEGMSLDGGPSSQLAYRADGTLYVPQASDVTVPTCLLVFADRTMVHEADAGFSSNR